MPPNPAEKPCLPELEADSLERGIEAARELFVPKHRRPQSDVRVDVH